MDNATTTRLNGHDAEFKEVWKRIETIDDSKVSKEIFFWVIGILIALMTTVLGYISYQINDFRKESLSSFNAINHDVTTLGQNVSSIQGKLDPYNLEFKN